MLLSLSIFIEILLLSLATYLLWYLPWVLLVLYSNKRQAAFADVPNFERIAAVVKGKRILYLSFYGFTIITTLVIDVAAIGMGWTLGETAISLEKTNLVTYLVTSLIIFILFHFGFCLIFWRLWKKINLKIRTKNEAINDFLFFKQNWIGDQPLKKVTIKTLNNKLIRGIKTNLTSEQQIIEYGKRSELDSGENFVLFLKFPKRQYSQRFASNLVGQRAVEILEKIYRWKLKRLAKKNLTSEQYSWKLLRIFIAYLNKCANFVLIVKDNQYYPFVSIDERPISTLWELKAALINNFFSYEQEFKH